MNCSEAQDLLSPYLDGELPEATVSLVGKHLETCSACASELASFQRLRQAVDELDAPPIPVEVWQSISDELEPRAQQFREPGPAGSPPISRPWTSLHWATAAGLLFLAAAVCFFGYHHWHHPHRELAADFSEYLEVFQKTPAEAHWVLVNKYAGRVVELDRAEGQLGYRPAMVDGLPDGYRVQTAYVMEMPCCKCIKCVCAGPDGTTLAIFEHLDEQPIWFGDRPSANTTCGGRTCTVTQLEDRIAVSWKLGKRYLTIVGAKDVREAAGLIEHLSRARPGFG